jgi:hypothetical protein
MNLPSETFCKCLKQCYIDKWLRKDIYWADHNAEVTKAIGLCSVAKLIHLRKKYIPT